jgi:hypothetical protein
MVDWPQQNENGLLQKLFNKNWEIEYWQYALKQDVQALRILGIYQWYYASGKNNGMSIEPSVTFY